METMEQCELQGAKLKASERLSPMGIGKKKNWHSVGFECVKGK